MRLLAKVVITLIVFSFLTSCEKVESKEVSVSEIMAEMQKEIPFENPKLVDLRNDKETAERYGISTDNIYQGFVYSSSTKDQSADEIVIVQAKDDKVQEIQWSLESEVTNLSSFWEPSSKTEYEKVQNHILKCYDDYIILAVCEEPDKAEKLFEKYIIK